jgi:hypothetical protein
MPVYQNERFILANGKKFRNMWQAYEELYPTSHNIELIIENSVFTNLKGLTVNPEYDYASYTIKKVFEKYSDYKINLMYSGGPDSHTIAVKARENNIQFDKTITFGESTDPQGNEFDKNYTTNIIKNFFRDDPSYTYIPNDLDWLEEVHYKKQWYLTSPEFGFYPSAKLLQHPIYRSDEIYIHGMDKPSLLYYDKQWYLYITHAGTTQHFHIPNSLYFNGLNNICPELAVQQARQAKNFYIEKFSTPEQKLKFINYKMFGNDPVFIREWNNAIGRVSVEDSEHDIDQTVTHYLIGYRGIKRLAQLQNAGKQHVIDDFFMTLKFLYDRHKQIDWKWPMMDIQGRIPWVLNIDTLECFSGSVVGEWTKNQ